MNADGEQPLWSARDREVLEERLADLGPTLLEVSHAIHARPETRFGETFASRLLVRHLADEGFTVETPLAGMDTAFCASWDMCASRAS